jgi:hypothetical protein
MVKKVLTTTGLLLLLITIAAFAWLFQIVNRGPIRMRAQTCKYISQNQAGLEILFTDIFDQAAACRSLPLEINQIACRQTIPTQIYAHIATGKDELTNFSSTYFVRLDPHDPDQLQKLFLSGNLVNEPINTPGERQVEQLLTGQRRSLPSYRLLDPVGNPLHHRYFNDRYLKDFYSELEIIVPYQCDHNHTTGAIVRLYAD